MYRLIKKNCFVKIQKIRREKGKFYAPRIFPEIFTDYKHIHNLHLKSLLYLTQMLIGSSIFPIRNTLVTRSKRTPPPVIIATHSNLVKRSSNIITTCPVQACVRAYTVLPLSSLVPPPSPPKESPKDTGLKPENVGRQLAGAQLNSADSRGLEAIPSPLHFANYFQRRFNASIFRPINRISPRCLGIVSAWPARIVNPAILRGVNSLAAQPNFSRSSYADSN